MNHLSATATFVVLGMALLWQSQSAQPTVQQAPAVSAAKPKVDASAATPPASPAPPAYTPTHDQSQSLTIDSLDAQLAQHTYAEEAQKLPSFAQFQQKVGKLQSDCAKVIADNHWPDGVQCDMSRVPVVFCVRLPCLGDAPAGASVVAPAVTPKP